MSNDSSKGYKFTVVNSVVTAVYEVKNGRTKYEKMDSDETWTFDGASVIQSEWNHGRLSTTTYSDLDGDGIFAKVSKSYGATPAPLTPPISAAIVSKGYQFDLVNGSVTSVFEIERGVSHQERIDLNETWTVQGNNIIKTEVEKGLTETTTFTDANGDGIFAKISKTYAADNGAVWNGTSGSDNDDAWKGSTRDDHYYAGNGNDALAGGSGNDDMYGADGNDRLSGDAGSDGLYGGIGNDVLSGGDGVDHIEGGLDNDALDGGNGDDYLSGGSGIDALTGGVGNDDLYGEDGNDILIGGAGSDDLYGGLGNDTFKFTNIYESGLTATTRDHIFDFAAGDKIDLSSIDAISGNRTNEAFNFVGTAANVTAANANGAVWFQNGIVYGSNDRDTAAEFQIELVGVNELNATYFIL